MHENLTKMHENLTKVQFLKEKFITVHFDIDFKLLKITFILVSAIFNLKTNKSIDLYYSLYETNIFFIKNRIFRYVEQTSFF